MENEYMTVPVACLKTRVFIKATEANHVYVSLRERGHEELSDALVIRGVSYHGSIHLYRWNNNRWYIGPEFKEDRGQRVPTSSYDQRHSVYLKRSDWLTRRNGDDGPSESARTLICNGILAAVSAFLLANPQVLFCAEVSHLTELVAKQEAEVQEAENNLQTARAKLSELRATLATLEAK